MIFLPAGLKYQDNTVTDNKINEGIASLNACPTITCERNAPDMAKKKPA